MPHLVENERTKLVANAIDRASTGCFVAGVFVPLSILMLGQSKSEGGTFIVALVCWALAGVVLHIEARRVLRALQE